MAAGVKRRALTAARALCLVTYRIDLQCKIGEQLMPNRENSAKGVHVLGLATYWNLRSKAL